MTSIWRFAIQLTGVAAFLVSIEQVAAQSVLFLTSIPGTYREWSSPVRGGADSYLVGAEVESHAIDTGNFAFESLEAALPSDEGYVCFEAMSKSSDFWAATLFSRVAEAGHYRFEKPYGSENGRIWSFRSDEVTKLVTITKKCGHSGTIVPVYTRAPNNDDELVIYINVGIPQADVGYSSYHRNSWRRIFCIRSPDEVSSFTHSCSLGISSIGSPSFIDVRIRVDYSNDSSRDYVVYPFYLVPAR